MAKYIDRDSLIEWLKRIRLVDLSDGLGICRVVMEDDFKKAITNMPENIIVDVAPVVRCKDCKYYKISELFPPHKFCFRLRHPTENRSVGYNFADDDFCSHGERR